MILWGSLPLLGWAFLLSGLLVVGHAIHLGRRISKQEPITLDLHPDRVVVHSPPVSTRTIAEAPASGAHEDSTGVGSPAASHEWVEDLVTLRRVANTHGLVEHVSDQMTVTLQHYPSALDVTPLESDLARTVKDFAKKLERTFGKMLREMGIGPSTPWAIWPGETLRITFKDRAVHAVGFSYQQGLYPTDVVIGVEGGVLRKKGTSWPPDSNFIGLHSGAAIDYVLLQVDSPYGTCHLQAFSFFSRQAHKRVLPPLTRAGRAVT